VLTRIIQKSNSLLQSTPKQQPTRSLEILEMVYPTGYFYTDSQDHKCGYHVQWGAGTRTNTKAELMAMWGLLAKVN